MAVPDQTAAKRGYELRRSLTAYDRKFKHELRAGLGISRLPAFFVAEDLADGRLVQLLPQYDLPKTVMTALYPRSVVPSLALRTLLDILPEWCRQQLDGLTSPTDQS